LWNEPIGSGPFKFDQREPNQLLAFTRNEVFFRDAPNLERVALVVAPDPAIAVDALSEEQLLLAEFPAVEAVSETDSITNVEQGSYPENGWYGVVFNTRLDRLLQMFGCVKHWPKRLMFQSLCKQLRTARVNRSFRRCRVRHGLIPTT
jgi:ABC-type transport system substrate-binding protein